MSRIIGIARLKIKTDGDGITTLVGFSGCPLHCRFCLNDQCHDPNVGKEYSVDELVKLVSIDSIYFGMTRGGVTFGGGEPLLHSEFIEEFCRKCDHRWKIRIETSLNIEWKEVERLIPYIDKWYIDIKDMNPEIYYAYTGTDNSLVNDNLKLLYDNAGADKVHIRIPKIPEYNSEEDIESTMKTLNEYDCEKEIFEYKAVILE